MSAEVNALVSALEIRKLFGSRDLSIDLAGSDSGRDRGQRLSLLYGNNGSGKTTALKLLWHALSPSETEGHRSEIGRTPFESFTIYLCRGDVIKFSKTSGLDGDFTVLVANGEKKLLEQAYKVMPDGAARPFVPYLLRGEEDIHQKPLFDLPGEIREYRVSPEFASEVYYSMQQRLSRDTPDAYVEYLQRIGTGPYMLADDRKIYGDGIEQTSRSRARRPSPERIREHSPTAPAGVTAELAIALGRVHDMVQRMVINGNVSGSRGSNNVYLGILEKISQPDVYEADEATREKLMDKLEEISRKTEEYSTYGLMPAIRQESFSRVLDRIHETKLGVAEDVLQPFLEAQEARLDALSGVAKMLATLTREVNRFFESSGKRVRYRTPTGLRVLSEEGKPLQPEDLSSGERQILLLLLNTVLARESTPLFLIDEPELSLNVKWQRQLMAALLALTDGTPVQFIVATHSIEVITGHRESLAKVAPKMAGA
ncbi:AAA family ATPase [Streptomyces sp. NPDC054797]